MDNQTSNDRQPKAVGLETVVIICPACDGIGKNFSRPILIKGKVSVAEFPCDVCNQTGQITHLKELWVAKGKAIKQYRLERGYGLREAAKKLNVDASNLSKMERGVIKPKNIYLGKL